MGKNKQKSFLYQLCTEADPISPTSLKMRAFTVGSNLDEKRMIGSKCCEASLVENVWSQKRRLSDVFDQGHGDLYHKARAQLYPETKGSRFCSRAGVKLIEIALQTGIFDDLENEDIFVDLCGGPGAWSQAILAQAKQTGCKLKGYGMSLAASVAPEHCAWIDELRSCDDWTAIWGPDGTGSVYSTANVEAAVAEIGEQRAALVVCDGGFQTTDADHHENCQELLFARLILSEVYLAFRLLKEEGHFCCKLVDTYSWFSCSLIYIITRCFEDVAIVKPEHSRVVNSERYIVAKGFLCGPAGAEEFEHYLKTLSNAHKLWTNGRPITQDLMGTHAAIGVDGSRVQVNFSENRLGEDESPVTLLPPAVIREDFEFMRSYSTMVRSLSRSQCTSVRRVMESVESSLQHMQE